jgi:hypothetical protein
MKNEILTGVVHKVPADLQRVLNSNEKVRTLWNDLTPLARNEWICWITIVRKAETRKDHIKRAKKEIAEGKRRPCCWAGCPHRRPSAKKWFSKYSQELINKKFIIEITNKKGRKFYSLSDKGLNFLEKYKTMRSFIEEFEL